MLMTCYIEMNKFIRFVVRQNLRAKKFISDLNGAAFKVLHSCTRELTEALKKESLRKKICLPQFRLTDPLKAGLVILKASII